MERIRVRVPVLLALLISGCAATSQGSLELKPGTLTAQSGRLGIGFSTIPKADTYFPGADCLLCIATASIMNSSLTSYVHALPTADLLSVKDQLAERIRETGMTVTVIPEPLAIDDLPKSGHDEQGLAGRDFSAMKQKYGVDKLLVIEVEALGMRRNYSAYIPNGAPYAILKGNAYIVNVSDNKYEWYQYLNSTQSSAGNWDEPPRFPDLTNAYFQAIEVGKDSLLKPFAR